MVAPRDMILSAWPAGTRVQVLLSWVGQRVGVEASSARAARARDAMWYPGGSSRAGLARGAAAAIAWAGIVGGAAATGGEAAVLIDEMCARIPDITRRIARPGTPGVGQKLQVIGVDAQGRARAFMKIGLTPYARQLVAHEAAILGSAQPAAAPSLLATAESDSAFALAVAPVEGAVLDLRASCPDGLESLLGAPHSRVPLADHPFVARLGWGDDERQSLLGRAGSRDWGIGLMHGDMAPWNILRRPDGSLVLLDWEYAVADGLEFADRAHFALQTARLVHRRSSQVAGDEAVAHLTAAAELPPSAASALVGIVARSMTDRCIAENAAPAITDWWQGVSAHVRHAIETGSRP